MDEETVEKIRQEYELGIVAFLEAVQTQDKAKKQIEQAETALKNAQAVVDTTREKVSQLRGRYEAAFYQFYEECNE